MSNKLTWYVVKVNGVDTVICLGYKEAVVEKNRLKKAYPKAKIVIEKEKDQ